MSARTPAQNEALRRYMGVYERYQRTWQGLTNVQFEQLRRDVEELHRAMVNLVELRTVEGKRETVRQAMDRTYPELRGPEVGAT